MADYIAGLFSLTGRVAVVTGGNSGIGEGMATALALAGARVVLIARDRARLEAVAGSLDQAGCQAAWVSADLGDRAEVARAATAAVAPFGEPDILVNCAGVNLRPPLGELTEDQWDSTLAVNLTAPFLLGQRFGPAMARRGWGRIINVTSQQAHRAFGNSGGYGAVQGRPHRADPVAVRGMGAAGVTVNADLPRLRPHPAQRARGRRPGLSAALASRTMVGRNGEPSDFAGAAVFLASPASGYVTGQTLFVDGGFSSTIARVY